MDSFSNFDLPENELPSFDEKHLGLEWATLNAIREMLGIALKGGMSPTYEQSLAFARVIAPEIFDSDKTLIGKAKEPDLVQEYRQKTQALSQIESRDVPATEIIDTDITQLKELLKAAREDNQLRRRLRILETTRVLLQPKKYTENQLILRDIFKAQRNIPVPPIDGDTYREFQLDKGRGLRIRLLHPDPPEHLVGADLVYETYWDKKELLRLAVVQYKIWNGQALYTSQAENLEEQLKKLKSIFCDSGLCEPPDTERANAYRLPFCAAFLRPTDALQTPNSRFISSGLHLPICVAARSWDNTGRGGKKIERKNVRSESLSHKVFEELFNTNMLGSMWLTYNEIDELYKKHKILDRHESVVIHAQEFSL